MRLVRSSSSPTCPVCSRTSITSSRRSTATPRILKSHRQSDEFYRAFWQTLLRGETVRTTHFNRSRAGRLLTVESTSSAVMEDGATVGDLAIERDVTLQREAERAAELAHVAIEHAPDAVCWFEPVGRILYVNRMTLSLTGFAPEELRTRSVFDLVPNGSREWFEERWRDVGAGTKVSVHLPRAERDVIVVTQPVPGFSAPVEEGTVLLVEDDASVRTVAARFLADHGYRVLVAQDVADALRIARTDPRRIDLFLTDIVMPSLNGPDLAQRIVEWRPSVRVLYASGYADALALGASESQRIAVVPKPFTADRLASAVRQALESA